MCPRNLRRSDPTKWQTADVGRNLRFWISHLRLLKLQPAECYTRLTQGSVHALAAFFRITSVRSAGPCSKITTDRLKKEACRDMKIGRFYHVCTKGKTQSTKLQKPMRQN